LTALSWRPKSTFSAETGGQIYAVGVDGTTAQRAGIQAWQQRQEGQQQQIEVGQEETEVNAVSGVIHR